MRFSGSVTFCAWVGHIYKAANTYFMWLPNARWIVTWTEPPGTLRKDLGSLGEEMRGGELSGRFLELSFSPGRRTDSGGQHAGFIFTQGQNLSVEDGTSETTRYNLGGGRGREGVVPTRVVFLARVSS